YRIGNGTPTFNVLGLGSGTGEPDIEILRVIKSIHPTVSIINEVVEPNHLLVAKYKELVADFKGFENVTFRWKEMNCAEYENQEKQKIESEKFDFIHMIQMLYYVQDIEATIKFFHSLLKQNGKLLIIILADSSGWNLLWKEYGSQLFSSKFQSLTSASASCSDIEEVLKRLGLRYQVFDIPSEWDITEIFIEDSENGNILLDSLTDITNFRLTAPPDLKAGVLNKLQQPECSSERDGKIIFNTSVSAIVVDK
ncbi:histamine N-methyltransferase-like, partial [Protopterus annectens]|uniref:histamine N-methyltransferase-like n=1 Tax=Protopterus annectens TaxID=7888 RepID=UPI001CFC3013